MSFSIGKPSITYSGSVLPLIDVVPRTRTEMPPPGALDACVTTTPAAVPWSSWSSDCTGAFSRAEVDTVATEPVTSARRRVP